MNNNISRKNVVSALLWKLIERGGNQIMQMVIQIILARILGPEDFGIMAIVLVFVNIAQVFVLGGFNVALIQKKDADDLDFTSIFYLSLSVSLIFYIVIYVASPTISNFYANEDLTNILRVIGILLFFGAINSIQLAYISRNLLFKASALSSVISMIFSGVAGIYLAYKGFGVWSLVIQQIVYNLINTLILGKLIRWRPMRAFSFSRVKGLFSYGGKILASNLIYRFYLELRTLIIGRVYNASAIGYYQRGEQIPRVLVNNIDGAIQSVILPTLSAYQDDLIKVKNMVRRSLMTSSFFVFPMMIGIAVTSKTIILLLLGEDWIPTHHFLLIFSLTYALWPMITINQQPIRALGRSDLILKTELIKRIIGIIMIIITVPISVEAVAIGFFIERIIETVINAIPNKTLLNYGYLEQVKDILPYLILSLIMGLVVSIFNFISMNLVLKLFLQILTGFIFYFGFSIITKNETLFYLYSSLKWEKTNRE